ncbi:MAG: tail fiber domain-containing protein [Bacteroidetes bacterium]|nr:tail fiber domain-containing protein [Bacteroidota bacterium]
MQGIYQRCRNTSTSNVSDAYNFYAQNDGACTPIRKYGFAAFMSGSGSTNTYGGYFNSNSSAGNNFGVWASAPDQTCTGGTSGSPGSCSGAAGYFNGEVWASADVYEFSDANLKDNIVAIQNASSLLSQFSPKQYTFNHQIHPNLHLPYGTRYGFIAQDVAAIAPDLVKTLSTQQNMILWEHRKSSI